MERGLKERLVGAAVLVVLAVIFIPMLLDDAPGGPGPITETNIPSRPDILVPDNDTNGGDGFTSRIVPIEPQDPVTVELPSADASVTQSPAVEPDPAAAIPPEDTQPQATLPESDPGSKPAPPKSEPESDPAPAPPKDARTQATPESEGAKPATVAAGWMVQLGSFSQQDNAEDLNKKLQAAGYDTFVEPVNQPGERVYRVRLGPQTSRETAEKLRDAINTKLGINGIVVSYP